MSIRSDTVYSHCIDLDAPCVTWDQCWAVLDAAERSRAGRFRSRELTRQWTIARAALRSILATYCDCLPIEIEFASGRFGKPELAGEFARTGVTFNLSHSGNMAVVVVGRETDVGIDIELKKCVRDWRRVAERFFSPGENANLISLKESCRMDAFFDCWTRKEAVIKATGEGLRARLDDFEVSLARGVTTVVLADYSHEQKYIRWRLENIDLGPQFAGALATPAHGEIEHRHQGAWRFERSDSRIDATGATSRLLGL